MVVALVRGAFLVAIVLRFVAAAGGAESAWWVWHRGEALRESEAAAVRGALIYWHVGVLENRDGSWKWKAAPIAGAGIPVVRLESSVREPFSDRDGFVREITRLGVEKAQVDFDCPDRLLSEYAAVLSEVHREVPWLSVTALAGWSRNAAFAELQSAVDELCPMFYDLRVDPAAVGKGAPPLPLIEPEQVARDIAGWEKCQVPWRAGLPNFARITIYDAQGSLRGHVRNWDWDDVCFNRALETLIPTRLGMTLMRARTTGRLGGTALEAGDLVAVRWPDRKALRAALGAAEKAGAQGEIYFRLPDRTDGSGWSIAQITHLAESEPSFSLRTDERGRLVLRNESHTDLAPRLAGDGPGDRGYALEIDATAAIWREALAGEFWRVGAHVEPDAKPAPVAVPLATRLTFWFSDLRAGDSLTSGLMQLAPGARWESARWRVVPGGEWKKCAR